MNKISYYPQFKGYGIADKELKKVKGLPLLSIGDDENAVTVGVLMGREPEHYCLQEDYVEALRKSGANVVLMDYENHLLQLATCDALLLPGGSFETPKWYYADAKTGVSDHYPCQRAQAYAECLKYAKKVGMPILGICAGMQIIAAEAGMKLYPSFDYIETPLKHKSTEAFAHRVQVVSDTPFAELMENLFWLKVNSRHIELLAPARVQHELLGLAPNEALPLQIYGLANDGVIEALGDMDKGILGVQWHPENLAVAGDALQQKIFDWLVSKASAFKNSK